MVTYPGNVNVPLFPWLTVDEGQGVAKLKVSSSDAAYEGYYTVTVKSKLYDTSIYTPEFKFKIYLHISPCLKSVLTWGANVPQDIFYQIRRG